MLTVNAASFAAWLLFERAVPSWCCLWLQDRVLQDCLLTQG